MYLRKNPRKNGRIHLSIVRGYRDTKGKAKAKTVKTLGYLDELKKQYDDPIAHFQKVVTQMNEENQDITITISKNAKLSDNEDNRKFFGIVAPSKIYHELKLDKFFLNKFRNSKASEHIINNIVKLLVFARLLMPASKKKTYENKHKFFDTTEYSLDEIYNSLSYINIYRDDIQKHVYTQLRSQYGNNTECVYYDVTNYYFEIDESDDLIKKGVCKEHRPNPIVQMGLLMDSIGLPISYKLFSGNTNDCETILPVTRDIKREYGFGRVIVVADKGLNTGNNIYKISNRGDGYVMSLSIRGANQELKDYTLEENGYTWTGTDFKQKSKLFPREIWITKDNGKKSKIRIDEKLVIFYSRDYDKRAKAQRQPAIDKAKDLIDNITKYNKKNCHGASKYVKHLVFDKKTGEIIEAQSKLSLDIDKIKEDEKFDGYYAIVTSEYKKTTNEIIEIYRGLWKIEETFKITKSDLESRPVFVKRENHIQGHFLTCYLALVISRVLQLKLKNKYSVSQILESLKKLSCSHIQENQYLFDYSDKVTKELGKKLKIDFTRKYRSLQEIKKILGQVKKS